MDEWRPIETAPKDGKRVLLFRAGFREVIAVGRWAHDWDEWMSVPGMYAWKATHWMPLPEPPK